MSLIWCHIWRFIGINRYWSQHWGIILGSTFFWSQCWWIILGSSNNIKKVWNHILNPCQHQCQHQLHCCLRKFLLVPIHQLHWHFVDSSWLLVIYIYTQERTCWISVYLSCHCECLFNSTKSVSQNKNGRDHTNKI